LAVSTLSRRFLETHPNVAPVASREEYGDITIGLGYGGGEMTGCLDGLSLPAGLAAHDTSVQRVHPNEFRLGDLLDDPIIQMIMLSDGVTRETVTNIVVALERHAFSQALETFVDAAQISGLNARLDAADHHP
jgi:hypothetical protein